MNLTTRRQFIDAALASAAVAAVGLPAFHGFAPFKMREIMDYDILSDCFQVRYDVKGVADGKETQVQVGWRVETPDGKTRLDPNLAREKIAKHIRSNYRNWRFIGTPEVPHGIAHGRIV